MCFFNSLKTNCTFGIFVQLTLIVFSLLKKYIKFWRITCIPKTWKYMFYLIFLHVLERYVKYICKSYKVKMCIPVCMLSRSVVYNSAQSVDGSPPGSSVHGIFQARILEWVAIAFARRSSSIRGQIHISYISHFSRWIYLFIYLFYH